MMKQHTTFLFRIGFIYLIFTSGLLSCNNKKEIEVEKINETSYLLHINAPGKYILLPIEESAGESQVMLRGESKESVPMNIRISTTKTDYYVPFELPTGKKNNTIEIYTPTTDPLLWDHIQISDTFDTCNREKFRLLYHHTPTYGWMNDPNGMVYLDGEYHLFYQYNPYGSMWGNMHWGHAISKDLIQWEQLGVAICPDTLGTIFSGNCIIDKKNTAGFGENAMIAFYTSAGEKQTQSIAYSTDKGRTFTKYDKNPVVTADIPDFRDPNVFYHEPTGKWIMVIAAGQEVQLYSSGNLLDWEYESSFGEGYGNHGGVWECPDLLELPVDGNPENKKWVLLLNINPGGIFGGSATQYFTGEFDGKVFTCESTPTTEKWMDWGKDHYATVTWANAPGNRSIAIAWMSNWQYANQLPTLQFRSANSVPREISLYTYDNETYLMNQPVKELVALRKNTQSHPVVVVDRYKPFNIDSLLEENEAIAFTNCPNVRELERIFPLTMVESKGFKDTCIMAFPIPNKEKESSIPVKE